jgi:PAS domain S-box-containing protein
MLLRKGAEARVASAPLAETSTQTAGELLHEVSVHQFELEMLRKAQVTLGESRDRYLNLYEFAPIGYLTLTQDAIVSEVNLTGTNMLGVERKELLNHRFSQIIAPEDRECWHRHFILALKHVEWQSCELQLQRGDGSRFFARLDCRHMEIGGESSVHIAISNITERRQSEIALKESELRFRMLFRTAGDGLHIMDVHGNLLQASDSFCRMLGYSQKELLGMNVLQWDALFPPDTLFEEKVNSLPEEGIVLETRHRCKDGHVIDVEIYCTAVSIQGEKFVYASSRDITERKENELIKNQLSEQIRNYTDTIADIYDHAPCGYHSLDKDGRFLHINETELNWLGYERYEIVGKKGLVDLLTPDSKPIFLQTFAHFKEVGEERDLELSLIRKDGTVLPVMISSSALYDADGNYVMSRSTVYDMTERIRMEQERIDYLKRMEASSRHLVAVQENTRRYLSSELHDRTSPNLAAISINLDIIAAELTQEHLLDLAERLEDTRALIVDTTESIREFVADMRPPLLDYAGLAAAIESHVQQFTRRTGIRIKFDCTNTEERFTPELESLLFRIFQEALTNCAKHSHAKFVRVALNNGTRLIRLTITDDGVGFDPAQLGRGVRIGLGLLNMRELAEVADGKLVIDSASGKGTCIAVEISLN